jgi:hypothetical protein
MRRKIYRPAPPECWQKCGFNRDSASVAQPIPDDFNKFPALEAKGILRLGHLRYMRRRASLFAAGAYGYLKSKFIIIHAFTLLFLTKYDIKPVFYGKCEL